MMRHIRLPALLTCCALALSACSRNETPAVDPAEAAAAVSSVADRYYAETLERTPEIAYFSGIEPASHDGLADNSPEARAAAELAVDEMLSELEAIDAGVLLGQPEWITYELLLQELKASVGLRVCRTELWAVNQMGGWHLVYPQIAQLQPVGSPELREQSIKRWSKFPALADQEIANLQQGLELGYSAPKTVVRRVISQLDGLLAQDVAESPFYSPASRDNNELFAMATRDIVEGQVYPALQRYRDYLATSYIEAARETLSVTANPDGAACYDASLFAYTTLDRTGREVYELGQATVAANEAAIIEMGRETYGTDDFAAIIVAAKADPADHFASREELLQFSRDAVSRAGAEMPNWVGKMPPQPVEVVPFPEHEEGTGRSAHYYPGSADRPGEYRIPLAEYDESSRGNAETTAFHETWPGHHLQVAVAQDLEGLHPVGQIIWFSGPGEGWARYAESLAEDMGLYETSTGPILRRAWPARGMVVDPGIHLFGWTREQAIEFTTESGRFPASYGEQIVDRIAILPGQLTAYDSGGLEILALRREAEAAMGDDFDIREFHDRVLENGTIPLIPLRATIEAWIADYQAGD